MLEKHLFYLKLCLKQTNLEQNLDILLFINKLDFNNIILFDLEKQM